MDDEQGCLEVLSNAVERIPKASLYERYLTLMHENSDEWESVNEEFKRCVEKLDKSESLPIWKMWLNLSSTKSREGTRKIFEKSLSASNEIAEFGRLQYLQWIYENDGLKAARKIYKKLRNVCPLTREFLHKAIDIESQQELPNIRELRKLHETAVDEFGRQTPDCWLEYIKFELNQSETAVETVNRIYWRALKLLDSKYTGDFVEKYTLLQAGSKNTDSE